MLTTDTDNKSVIVSILLRTLKYGQSHNVFVHALPSYSLGQLSASQQNTILNILLLPGRQWSTFPCIALELSPSFGRVLDFGLKAFKFETHQSYCVVNLS